MIRSLITAAAAMTLTGAASAATYTDSAGDTFTGAGGGILDILALDVTDDGTSISFQFTLAGDVVATDWGKYMVIIDSAPGGDTAGNGWARPIGFANGAETWLGGWVDSGNGLENRGWDGAAWQLNGATYNGTPGLTIGKTQFTATLTVKLADIGLSANQIIFFDAFTSGGGGGDGAIDSAANAGPSVFDWGEYYQAGGANPFLTYQVSPTPGAAGLVGVAGLAMFRRRR